MQQSKKFRKVMAVLMVIAMLFSIATPAMAYTTYNPVVTIVPASHPELKPIVKVGDSIGGGTVKSISGATIKVQCTMNGGTGNTNTFKLPYANQLWDISSYSMNYISWAGQGGNTKSEGASAGLSDAGCSAYYYFTSVTPGNGGGGSTNYLWNFTLKFDANGGSGAPASLTYGTNNKYTKSYTFTIPNMTPTRSGYIFKGWGESASSASATYQPGGSCLVSAANISGYNGGSVSKTLYAVWEKEQQNVTYTLKYDANGGTGAPGDQTATNANGSATFTISNTEPTRDGYTFLGWAESASAVSATHSGGDKITLTSSAPKKTLYAVWQPQKPAKPDDDTVKALLSNAVKIDCTNNAVSHSDRIYGLLDGNYSVGDVQGDATAGYTCVITVNNAAPYVNQYNADVVAEHALSPENQGSKTITLKYENNAWAVKNTAAVPVTFTVVCETRTETDTVPSITKTTSATDVKVGDTFAYTITVKNSDTDLPTTKVTVTDSLPDGLEYVENTVNGATATFVQDGQNLTWTMDKLEADAAATITLTVKATKAGKYTNSATVTTDKGSNNDEADEVPVTEPATPPVTTDWDKLTISKIADKNTVKAGEAVVYTITVVNNTGVNLTGIKVSEKLDDKLTFVSAVPSDQYNATSGVWTIAALGNGKTATLTITAKAKDDVADKTMIPNTATITAASDTSDGTNNLPEGKGPSANVDITVNNGGGTDTPTDWSKLTVNKTVAVVTGSSLQFILDNPGESILPDAKVTTGSNLLYTITVSNDTGKDLTGITVQEALDSNLTFAESDGTSYDVTEGLWTIEQLADGAKAVLHILAVVNDDAAAGSEIENTAIITAAQDDGDGLPDRNRPSDTVTVTVDETVPGPVEPINPQPPEPGKDDDNDEEDDNNGNTSSGGSDRYDGPYSDDEETPEEDVPLTDATEPETNPAEDVPDNTDENHIIEDSDVPLSDLPGESLEITEPQVPLGDAPKTGDAASATAYAGLLAFAAGGLMITRRKYN